MASLSTCHLGLWLGWQILLNLVKSGCEKSWAEVQADSFTLVFSVGDV